MPVRTQAEFESLFYSLIQTSIMLIGHSAGAHLCLMSVLELTLQRMLQQSTASLQPESSQPIRFEDCHFDNTTSTTALSTAGGITESFVYVDDTNKPTGGDVDATQSADGSSQQKVDLLASIKVIVGRFYVIFDNGMK